MPDWIAWGVILFQHGFIIPVAFWSGYEINRQAHAWYVARKTQ